MSGSVVDQRLMRDGTLLGSSLLRASEHLLIADYQFEANILRDKLALLEQRSHDAIVAAASDAASTAKLYASSEILASYAEQQERFESCLDDISTRLIERIAQSLEIALTAEQVSQVLGNALLREAGSSDFPRLAIRINPLLYSAFEVWLNENCPQKLRDSVMVFSHESIPENCLLVRADSTVFELQLMPILSRLAINAATEITNELSATTARKFQ